MMKIIDKVLVGASLLGFSGFLLADPLDYSGFTGAVDVATVSAAIVAMVGGHRRDGRAEGRPERR